MNRIIGEIHMKQESILHGDHQIAVSAPLADGQTGLSAGTVLYLADGAYSGCKSTDVSSVQPAAVLLENIDGETADTQALTVIHGAVRADKLQFADGKPLTAEAAAKLRLCGIYALGSLPPAAQAPVIDTQPQAVTVNKTESASLTVIAHSVDGGNLSYQWYKNTSNSASGGSTVPGGNSAELTLDTSTAETAYYYCTITNTLGSTAAEVTSAVAAVTINEGE